MYEHILYDVEDPIATITLNRPAQLNAWTDRMGAEVRHAFAEAEADPRVVVVIVTGAGRGFCAGADLKQLEQISEGERGQSDLHELAADPGDPELTDFRGTYTYPMSIPKPVIAAINGPIAGMAVPIAAACDLRFASDAAVFTTAFAQRGLVAEWGISWLLTRLCGPAHALDLLLSARKIDAHEAERMGFVNRTLPHDELLPFVRDYARKLAAGSSPASMAIMKRQVYQQLHASLGPSEKEAVRLMVESFDRPDFKEGVRSFLEKRKPAFPRLKR
jgi:enoyl-CoA hydratase/carnithine racemase